MDTPQGRGSAHHGTRVTGASRGQPAVRAETTPAGTNRAWEHSGRSGASSETNPKTGRIGEPLPRHNGFREPREPARKEQRG